LKNGLQWLRKVNLGSPAQKGDKDRFNRCKEFVKINALCGHKKRPNQTVGAAMSCAGREKITPLRAYSGETSD
jgi:hypothetical protein